ncbi:MAG TPA: DUF4105 domain-containing protein [Gemmatimonas sp.]|nr:DUF4105 domain-containing protein [Gemmatimonas sp.]
MRFRAAPRAWLRAALVALSLLVPAGATGQGAGAPVAPGVSPATDSVRNARGQSLVVSLLTYGPGDEVFERFGHVALSVRDTLTGQDVAYNWGMFDFDQPNFLGRFLTGDTKYWMEGFPTDLFNGVYTRANRGIRRQTFALTPVERAALLEYVSWQSQEENKYYRYDYYRDNCATRIRDLLDWTLRGRLRPELSVPGAGRTWRGETERITANDLPVFAGIEVALGRDADRKLSRWEEAFLPEHMASSLASVVLRDSSARRYRLVNDDSVIFAAGRVPLPSEPPDRVVMAALLGLTIAGLIAVLADARGRFVRVALSVLVAGWYLVGGLLGTLLLLAGTVTKHAPYMGNNTTLLQLHPLLLVAAFAVPIALIRHRRTRAAMGVSATVALLSVIGLLLQLVPALSQRSGVVLAVTVPVHVALAVAVWRLGLQHGSPQSSHPGANRDRDAM